MAEQKFLGQAGTDVLVEKIKEPLIDKYLAPFRKYKDLNIKITDLDDMVLGSYVDLYASIWTIHWGFTSYGSYLWSNFFEDEDWSSDTTVGEFLTHFLQILESPRSECNNLSIYEILKTSDLLTQIWFAPYNKQQGSTTSIEEITAQEVSDKFNS